jgi:uncharacterized protein involved in outer membrane biogenesis
MDDLLAAFLADTAQSLGKCEADLDRLRRSPDGAAALADMLGLLGTIRETSEVMGLRELQAAAALAVEAVQAAIDGEDPTAATGMAPALAEHLARLRGLVDALGRNATDTSKQEPTLSATAGEAVLTAKRQKPKKKAIALSDEAPKARPPADPPLTARPEPVADPPLTARREPRSDPPLTARTEPPAASDDSAPAPLPPDPPVPEAAPRLGAAWRADVAPVGRAQSRSGRRRLRRVLLVAGGTLVAAAIALVVAARSIDVKSYGALIAREVEAATGRQLTLKGDLELGFSLTPTVIANDVTLANMATGSRPEMISVRRLEVRFALLPLLHGEVQIRRLALVGADILLERDAQGRANWLFGETADAATKASTPPSASGSALPSVDRLSVEDTRLTYRDNRSAESHTLTLDRLTAATDDATDPVEIDLAGSVNGQPVTLAGKLGPLQALLDNRAASVDLTGDLAGNALMAKGQLAQPLEAKGVQLALSAAGQSLASFGPALGTALPAFGPYDLATTISDPDGTYHFDGLKARLGQSNLVGALTLRRDGPRPRLEGQLVSTLLDLADFEERGAVASRGDGRLFSDAPLPVGLLSAIDGAVRLSADRFVSGRFALSAAALDLALADGRLAINSFQAGFEGGTLAGTGAIGPGDTAPTWQLDLQGHQLAMGDLLRDLFGSAALSGGRADLAFQLQSQGNSLRAVMGALDGTASLSVAGGRINDDLVNVALAGIFESLTLAGGNDGGLLNCAVAQFDLADGVGQSRRAVADLRGATVVGTGRIDLRNESIAMRFTPASKHTNLARFAGPFDVVGPLASPSVRPDVVGTATNAVGAAASVGTLGIADSIVGLAGINLTNKNAGASCAVAANQPAATSSQKTSTGTTTTGTTTTRRKNSGGLLDDVTEGLRGAGTQLQNAGEGLQNLFDGATPTNNKTSKTKGSKDSK